MEALSVLKICLRIIIELVYIPFKLTAIVITGCVQMIEKARF